MRALILALDRWAGDGAPPPPSAYPHLADGTLESTAAYRATFPQGAGVRAAGAEPARAAPGFRTPLRGARRIADKVPPVHGGKAFETRVPAPDADGNDRGGVRMVELRVPLGTHTGWNERAPETGFGWATARFDGSFVPFARTRAERLAANDPGPAVARDPLCRPATPTSPRCAPPAGRQVARVGFLLHGGRWNAVVNESVGLFTTASWRTTRRT